LPRIDGGRSHDYRHVMGLLSVRATLIGPTALTLDACGLAVDPMARRLVDAKAIIGTAGRSTAGCVAASLV
jgi:hypothetical protein